jgi:hypothetical protein
MVPPPDATGKEQGPALDAIPPPPVVGQSRDIISTSDNTAQPATTKASKRKVQHESSAESKRVATPAEIRASLAALKRDVAKAKADATANSTAATKATTKAVAAPKKPTPPKSSRTQRLRDFMAALSASAVPLQVGFLIFFVDAFAILLFV